MRVPLKRMSSMWIESIVWRFRDISEKRKREELIRYQAEGVETEDHANFLKDHDCDIAQGYLYGRPLPADEFIAPYHNDNAGVGSADKS